MIELSIIIPIYNADKYLDKCISSVLCQTYKNFELILINDGSSDTSLSICQKYQLLEFEVTGTPRNMSKIDRELDCVNDKLK
ncbi:glycosyltransferase family A protein [Niallia alba]|uniref:glycosyltransferase family 2 protein n=1 Tax=Niallia alba TaxID=2729105 RepID=UPI002E1EFBFD|nr:glycosyltransferase family A protein [Niallia alba]